jgi:hypothetical protein
LPFDLQHVRLKFLDRDTHFVIRDSNLQGTKSCLFDDTNVHLRVRKFHVVQLPLRNEWREIGQSEKEMDISSEYLIENESYRKAVPSAPIEIYEGRADGSPAFRGTLGTLEKRHEGRIGGGDPSAGEPVRVAQQPVIAKFAQRLKVEDLERAMVKIETRESWTLGQCAGDDFHLYQTTTSTFQLVKPPKGPVLFLPAVAMPGCGGAGLIGEPRSHNCRTPAIWLTEAISLNARFYNSLSTALGDFQKLNDDIVHRQAEIAELQKQFADVQNGPVGDGREAELALLQGRITAACERLALKQRGYATAKFQIARMRVESDKTKLLSE